MSFQRNAFQNNAFQVVGYVPPEDEFRGGRRQQPWERAPKHNPYRSIWENGFLTTHLAHAIPSEAQVGEPGINLTLRLEASGIPSDARVSDLKAAYSDFEDALIAVRAMFAKLKEIEDA